MIDDLFNPDHSYRSPTLMPNATADSSSLAWLGFALLTVATWGLYGVLLHTGQLKMNDPVDGRYKAFLWVGLAYFLTAVLAPLILLWMRGASWSMPMAGMGWSLIAGIAGAAGAFGVLLAFGAKGSPAVVMSIVFGGAPVVNAIVALMLHPPHGGWSTIRWPFFLGIVMAAAGGCLVTLYRPIPAKPASATPPASAADAAPTAR